MTMPNKLEQPDNLPSVTGPSVRAPAMPDDPPQESDADALVARYEGEAQAIDARDVTTFTGSTSRAVINVQTGVNAVLAEGARFQAKGAPAVDLKAIEETVGLAKALDFAARRVRHGSRPSKTKQAEIRRAGVLRKVLVASARALVEAGLLDRAEVKRITGGRGPTRVAQSCCDLAALFRRHEATIRGSHAATEAQINEAASLGAMLVGVVVPRGAKAPAASDPATAQATALRDRLGVLLTRRYFAVESAGGWLWGRAVVDHVPALLAFERGAKKAPAAKSEVTDEDEAVDDVTPEGGW
jgi:hypothetical protein